MPKGRTTDLSVIYLGSLDIYGSYVEIEFIAMIAFSMLELSSDGLVTSATSIRDLHDLEQIA